MSTQPCKICGASTAHVGEKKGSRTGRIFNLDRCADCGYAFVSNPWEDFANIYDEDYYQGRGSDPLVDYLFELEHPDQTIRQFEWQGIVSVVRQLTNVTSKTRWLDFGCGNGGLVRHCRQAIGCEAYGFEEGWIRDRAVEHGIPMIDQSALNQNRRSFDVVTAIEVLEHAIDPIAVLRTFRELLKPGGLLFLTTGNAQPFAGRLLDWCYVVPEIHVSYFEPRTLELAMTTAGFRVSYPGFCDGYKSIIQFKVLKNLGFHRKGRWLNAVPWGSVAKLCDARFKISALPVGWAVK